MSSISQLRGGLLSRRLAAFFLILAAIIAIAISACIAPRTAYAAGGSLVIGSESVDVENGGTYCGGKAVYDASTRTLTLDGLDLTCIKAELESLTIRGSATLTSNYQIGIYVCGPNGGPGDLTLDGDFTIDAPYQDAICVEGDGPLAIAGGTVHATSEYQLAIAAGSLELGDCEKVTLPEDGDWSDVNEVKIEPANHTYGDVRYDWADDMGSCTASLTCTTCGYSFYEKSDAHGTVTKEPTCTADGEMTYEAIFVKIDFPNTEKAVPIPATGHVEGDPVRENETAAGYDEVVYCTACGEELSRTHVVNKATLTFDLGGGTLDGKTGTITIEANVGDTVKLPAAPTREGYTFKCWKGSEYAAGADYKVEGDHTFTAEWEKDAEPAPSKPDCSAKPAIPATGDNVGMLVLMLSVAALGSLCVLAGCASRRRAYRGKHSR